MCSRFSIHPFWYQAFAPSVEPVFRSSRRFALGISGFRCRWRWFWNMSPSCSARALFQALQQRRFTEFWMLCASWRSITRCFLHGDHCLKTPTMTLFWNSRSRLRPLHYHAQYFRLRRFGHTGSSSNNTINSP